MTMIPFSFSGYVASFALGTKIVVSVVISENTPSRFIVKREIVSNAVRDIRGGGNQRNLEFHRMESIFESSLIAIKVEKYIQSVVECVVHEYLFPFITHSIIS
jgi:hypothetical protein